MSLDIVAILSSQLSLLGKTASSLPVAAALGAATEIDYNTQLPIEQTPDANSKELQKLDSAGELSFTWKRKKAAWLEARLCARAKPICHKIDSQISLNSLKIKGASLQ